MGRIQAWDYRYEMCLAGSKVNNIFNTSKLEAGTEWDEEKKIVLLISRVEN